MGLQMDELCPMKHGATFNFTLTSYHLFFFFFFGQMLIAESSPIFKEQNQRKVELNFN